MNNPNLISKDNKDVSKDTLSIGTAYKIGGMNTHKRDITNFNNIKFPSIPVTPKAMKLWKEKLSVILKAHGCDKYLVVTKIFASSTM